MHEGAFVFLCACVQCTGACVVHAGEVVYATADHVEHASCACWKCKPALAAFLFLSALNGSLHLLQRQLHSHQHPTPASNSQCTPGLTAISQTSSNNCNVFSCCVVLCGAKVVSSTSSSPLICACMVCVNFVGGIFTHRVLEKAHDVSLFQDKKQ